MPGGDHEPNTVDKCSQNWGGEMGLCCISPSSEIHLWASSYPSKHEYL